ncbi:P1 family peptidase [Novosphingobium sp.]|uniref:P1 family peptidase n=1 Tax=Novosphingobium sp. TaxID=1874826 RepID=UPI003342A58C
MTMPTGANDLITDVAGLRVGHAASAHHRTGTTVLVCDGLWPAAADVRGGGPGLREIDVMVPENLVSGIHAIVLSGGSVFGLAAADGALVELAAAGIGLPLGPAGLVVPIVPGAVLFDLNQPGDKAWGLQPPYHDLGRAAARAALDGAMHATFALGSVGAGTGAMAGTVKGGIGSASLHLDHGLVVGALVAVNPVGAVSGVEGWGFAGDPFPDGSRLAQAAEVLPGTNTTLAVIACNAKLDKAEAKRLAIMAQDGFARVIRPVHTPFDGDVVFALASGAIDLDPLCVAGTQRSRPWWLARLGAAAADCVARAIVRGVAAAR